MSPKGPIPLPVCAKIPLLLGENSTDESPRKTYSSLSGWVYFFTICITSSWDTRWLIPTFCGLYLALLPWKSRNETARSKVLENSTTWTKSRWRVWEKILKLILDFHNSSLLALQDLRNGQQILTHTKAYLNCWAKVLCIAWHWNVSETKCHKQRKRHLHAVTISTRMNKRNLGRTITLEWRCYLLHVQRSLRLLGWFPLQSRASLQQNQLHQCLANFSETKTGEDIRNLQCWSAACVARGGGWHASEGGLFAEAWDLDERSSWGSNPKLGNFS